jgi:CHAT domain-containing protein
LLSESRDTLEELKAAELRDYFDDECVDAQRQGQVESIPGAVIVYPIVLPDRVELIVGDPSGLRSFVTPVDRERFDAQVHELRRLLEDRTSNEYRRPAQKLYEWLIAPLEKSLDSMQVDALVFVPGGSLRTIPMAALLDPKSGQFLIEKYPIAVTPGLTLTEPRRIDPAQVELLSAGVSVSRQGFPALPYVATEIEAIHEEFEGVSLMDEGFLTSSLQQNLEQKQFGIVHIASHGEFGSSIEESYVLTFDDRLSVDDLGQLVGTARFRGQPVELLTLSACETAAGDERAALGLAGLAIRSGARSALATLWLVNELVSDFYRELAKPELSRAAALQAAQIKMLRQPHFQHPSFWSPFLLIGSWL